MTKITDIAQYVKDNPNMTDLEIKKAIEDKWIGIDVQYIKYPLAKPPYTILYLHNEMQDNYLMAMIDRDTK